MFDSPVLFSVVAGVWAVIGVVLSLVMGRRGHSSFSWLVVGAVLGPLAVILALDSKLHAENLAPVSAPHGRGMTAVTGPVDVLVGYDGSAESAAAIDGAADLLAERLGRLTIVTAVPFDGGAEDERIAHAALGRLAVDKQLPPSADFAVLHGHASDALGTFAAERGYEVIAVGTRGTGVTRRLLGSAASELARASKVPVLMVGQR